LFEERDLLLGDEGVDLAAGVESWIWRLEVTKVDPTPPSLPLILDSFLFLLPERDASSLRNLLFCLCGLQSCALLLFGVTAHAQQQSRVEGNEVLKRCSRRTIA
jgi:hypothetical protein